MTDFSTFWNLKAASIKCFPTDKGVVFVAFDKLEHTECVKATCNEKGEEVFALPTTGNNPVVPI